MGHVREERRVGRLSPQYAAPVQYVGAYTEEPVQAEDSSSTVASVLLGAAAGVGLAMLASTEPLRSKVAGPRVAALGDGGAELACGEV